MEEWNEEKKEAVVKNQVPREKKGVSSIRRRTQSPKLTTNDK